MLPDTELGIVLLAACSRGAGRWRIPACQVVYEASVVFVGAGVSADSASWPKAFFFDEIKPTNRVAR